MGLGMKETGALAGKEILDHKLIARKYVRSWLPIDVVSIIPWEYVLGGFSGGSDDDSFGKVLKMMKCIKLLRMARIFRIVNRFARVFHLNPAVVRIGLLVLGLVVGWHWIGCAYWFISSSEPVDQRGGGFVPPAQYWAVDSTCDSEEFCTGTQTSVGSRWLRSVGWAVVVTTGVGYDIEPNSDSQQAP